MAKMCHYKFGVKGWTVGRTESDFNAMYGPNRSAEAEFKLVDLVSQGQVWQY